MMLAFGYATKGSNVILDGGPFHIRGALRARYARVVWADGTLYVVNKHGGGIQRQTAQTTEPIAPEYKSGTWKATTDEAKTIFWSSRGCGG